MEKVGRPGFEGKKILVKIPDALLEKVDEVWPKTEHVSRNAFIRHALWRAVQEYGEVA
ncbi:MAG: ribbon-helix-helix domain-containing protein [Candidatus Methanosuratincola petrocarbonis]